jgi:uncharacterized phiE125 gp8 family phage protein
VEHLERIAGPDAEPVTLEEIKEHLRIDGNDEDGYLFSLLQGAREFVEDWTRQSLTHTRWRWTLDAFPPASETIELPIGPLVVITPPGVPAEPLQKISPSIEYINGTDTETTNTLTHGVDFLAKNSNPPTIDVYGLQYWPTILTNHPYPVTIEFIAGYSADGSRVPPVLKQAIKMLVAHWYQNREAVGTIGAPAPMAVDSLLRLASPGDYQ